MSNALELTNEQKRIFKRLKKAYSDAKKSGIDFYNSYGTLYPYQTRYVERIDDDLEGCHIEVSNASFADSLNIANEWSDDSHFIHLTEEGISIHNNH